MGDALVEVARAAHRIAAALVESLLVGLGVERDGAAALVDVVSLALLKGSEIDFVDELAGAEFRVRNPNAKSSCGCGVSFSI